VCVGGYKAGPIPQLPEIRCITFQQLTPKKKPKTTGGKRKLEELPLEELLDLGETSQKNGFLRIQLGDQTDSKMLLGQYRCTDVPGEFVWLPGVLTQVS